MNMWLLALGVAWILLGIFILFNRAKVLKWSQKHLRQNVGEVGKSVAEAGKASHMVGPGIGAIFIGVVVLLQGMNVM